MSIADAMRKLAQRSPYAALVSDEPVIPDARTDPAAFEQWRKAQYLKQRQENIGRRIRFLTDPMVTERFRQNEIEMYGRQLHYYPRYGETGVIVDMPPMGSIGAGPQVRWDCGQVSWLGSVDRHEDA